MSCPGRIGKTIFTSYSVIVGITIRKITYYCFCCVGEGYRVVAVSFGERQYIPISFIVGTYRCLAAPLLHIVAGGICDTSFQSRDILPLPAVPVKPVGIVSDGGVGVCVAVGLVGQLGVGVAVGVGGIGP